MAEAFSNKVARAAGIVTSYSGSTIGAGSTSITVTALTGIGVSFLVDNQNFIAGTRVHSTLPVSGGVGTVFTAAIASKIPIPAGSSFVISDTGKTLLESGDELKVYCDTTNAVDVSLSILTGVN
jgi:hypothetical protein